MSPLEPARVFEGWFWVFVLLAVALGSLLCFLQGEPSAETLRPLFSMALGGFVACIAQEGVHRGRIRPSVFVSSAIGVSLMAAGLGLSLSGL